MTPVFADTGYWIALNFHSDELHDVAMRVTLRLGSRSVVTSEMVLTEFLDGCAGQGVHYRRAAVRFVRDSQSQGKIQIVPMSSELFEAALTLYEQRPDKEWSLTDCASIVICRQEVSLRYWRTTIILFKPD